MGNSSSSTGSSTRAPSSYPSTRNPPAFNASPSFERIRDKFNTLEDVQAALRREGLESSNLIVAIDYTKSNEWTGKYSFGGKSLHHINDAEPNPYQRVINVVARTLSAFDDDNLIPCYGFGDASTGDRRVFSFKEGDQPCMGLEEVNGIYRQITPHVKLSGPTSFAPAIYQAMKIVADSGNQYHILVLVADGQVTRPSDARPGELSPQEEATVEAIVRASSFPLSIVMVGVGDGPWDMMNHFDDQLPERRFDNFQFVNATQIMQRFHPSDWQRMEATFARDALMEIPEQYKTIQRMGLIGRASNLNMRVVPPAPPPAPRLPPAPTHTMPAYASAPPAGYPNVHNQQPSFAQPGVPQAPSAPPYPAVQSAAYPYDAGSQPRTSAGSSAAASARPSSTGQDPDALYVCPITQELMQDPVLAADGYTYDRTAIEKWLRTHNTSPMTNDRLPHKNLTPNHALRSSILEYIQNTQRK